MSAFDLGSSDNKDSRRILMTCPNSQVVSMYLQPGEEIGLEIHSPDQIFHVISGRGTAIVGDKTYSIYTGVTIVVPGGTRHNIINGPSFGLKLLTVYAPPHH